MRCRIAFVVSVMGVWFCAAAEAQTAGVSGCLACHKGIEPIRAPGSGMMGELIVVSRKLGDPSVCVVCHGGDKDAMTAEEAHSGRCFYPEPGSPGINKFTCGRCHAEKVRTQWNSLMMTEAGKASAESASWVIVTELPTLKTGTTSAAMAILPKPTDNSNTIHVVINVFIDS